MHRRRKEDRGRRVGADELCLVEHWLAAIKPPARLSIAAMVDDRYRICLALRDDWGREYSRRVVREVDRLEVIRLAADMLSKWGSRMVLAMTRLHGRPLLVALREVEGC